VLAAAAVVAFWVGLIGVMARLGKQREARRLDALDSLAAEHGWQRRGDGGLQPPECDGLEVIYESVRVGTDTKTQVRIPVGADPRLEVYPEPLFRILAPDKTLGHAAFDKAAVVRGPDEELIRLDEAFREAFMAARGDRVEPRIEHGDIIARVHGVPIRVDWILRLDRHARAMARAFPRDAVDVVAERGLQAAGPDGYRLRCLQLLREHDPDRAHDALVEAAEPGPRLAIAVARATGDTTALRAAVHREDIPWPVGLEALEALGAVGASDDVVHGVEVMVGRSNDAQLRAVAERVADGRIPRAAHGMLAAAPKSARSGELVARALGTAERGDRAVEEALVRLLAHDEAATRHHAADALRRVGTVAAVQPLQRAAEEAGMLDTSDVRAAANQAIATIQGQVDGERGAISVADAPDAGAVSVADPSGAGAVAVADDEDSGDGAGGAPPVTLDP